MLLPRISALLLAASTANALKDAYPFLMLPTSYALRKSNHTKATLY